MTQNIEQRTEVAVTRYEGASSLVNELGTKDKTVDTPSGLRDSFPKLSRELREANIKKDVDFASFQSKNAAEHEAAQSHREIDFIGRFSLSQQPISWTPSTTISDKFQRYFVGVVGDASYKEFLPNPSKLPFDTSASIEEDFAKEYWLENGVPSTFHVDEEIKKNSEIDTGTKQMVGTSLSLIGKVISNENALRLTEKQRRLRMFPPPSPGEVIASINDFEVAFESGFKSKLLQDDYEIHADKYIKDYFNPTDSELDFLMSCGCTVLWRDAHGSLARIFTTKTINLQGNTIWKAIKEWTVTFVANHSDYVFHTQNNMGFTGTIGISFDGNFLAESIVQYTNCNRVIAKHGEAKNIQTENVENYRGAWIFLNVESLDYDDLDAKNIEQNPQPGSPHGQHHSYSFNNVKKLKGGVCKADNVDKLFHITGLCSGDAGMFIGTNLNDNGSYIMGTPQGVSASFILDGFQEALVYNPSSDEASFTVPYINAKNGTSRLLALRSGAGLRIGKFIGVNARNGISDKSYAGTKDVQIDDFHCENILEERGLDLENSDVTIGRFKGKNITSMQYGEVGRVGANAKFKCDKYETEGGTAATALRIQHLDLGRVLINTVETDCLNKVVYEADKDFGGKSFIGRINGFLIQGGAPSTLTVSNNAITISQSSHRIDPEEVGDVVVGELHTIDGAPSIDTIVTLQTRNNTRDVIIKHGVGNIHLPNGQDIKLNSTNDTIQLKWNGKYWSKPV
ncbi:hypothetical protein ACOKWN_002325 [Vibrio parahaemolyticus]